MLIEAWPRSTYRPSLFNEKGEKGAPYIHTGIAMLNSKKHSLIGQLEMPQETPEINMDVLLRRGSGEF